MCVLLSMLRVRVVLVLMLMCVCVCVCRVCVDVCVCRVCVCVACVDLTLTTNVEPAQMFIYNLVWSETASRDRGTGVRLRAPPLHWASATLCSATASRNLTNKIRERIVRDEHTYTQRTPPQPTIT